MGIRKNKGRLEKGHDVKWTWNRRTGELFQEHSKSQRFKHVTDLTNYPIINIKTTKKSIQDDTRL